MVCFLESRAIVSEDYRTQFDRTIMRKATPNDSLRTYELHGPRQLPVNYGGIRLVVMYVIDNYRNITIACVSLCLRLIITDYHLIFLAKQH